METRSQQFERIHSHWQRYREIMPDVADAYDPLPQTAYSGGLLDARTKRIMAIAIAVTHGCTPCMLFQTREALRLGAGAEEILEACGVAISIGGTMAAGQTSVVVEYLDELGVLPQPGV